MILDINEIKIEDNLKDAIPIFKEAAQWLIDNNKKLWDIDEFDENVLLSKNPNSRFFVCYYKNEPIASFILKFEDKEFWPNLTDDNSVFLHKICVKRKYSGQGILKLIITKLIAMYKNKGVEYIRLDCAGDRSKLCKLYAELKFQKVEPKKMGEFIVTLYELNISSLI